MNTNLDNKYERYILPHNWKLFPHPIEATKLVLKENFLNVFKVIYGEQDPDSKQFYFPQGWLYKNVDLVSSYFQVHKVDHAMCVEMGVDCKDFPPQIPNYDAQLLTDAELFGGNDDSSSTNKDASEDNEQDEEEENEED